MINPRPEANASRVRVPTLRQIFWGPLANGCRRIAQWRKQGVLAEALQENRRQAMRLEALEPRLLLSADLSFTTTTDHDVTVLFDVPSDEIRIVDSLVPATILAQQAVGDTAAVRITGSSSADHVIVDLTTAFDVPVFFEDATGADGDELSVVGSDVVSWTLSGFDEGSVAAAGGITFTDVENLSGDALNRDTFIIGDAALLVGTIDGGVGGFDTLVMRSPTAVTLSDTEIQTQGGAVVFDIAGFESGVFEASSLSAATFNGQTLLTTCPALRAPGPWTSLSTPSTCRACTSARSVVASGRTATSRCCSSLQNSSSQT